MRTASFVVSALVTLVCTACGSDGPGTGPLTAAEAEDGCRADCEHRIACDPQPDQTVEACTADCVSDVAGWVRADAFEAIIDCTTALACDASDDACLAECVPTSAHDAYEAQCREVFAPCGSPEEVDGICEVSPNASTEGGLFCLVAPSIIDEMTDCIPDGTTCQAGVACINAVAESHGLDL